MTTSNEDTCGCWSSGRGHQFRPELPFLGINHAGSRDYADRSHARTDLHINTLRCSGFASKRPSLCNADVAVGADTSSITDVVPGSTLYFGVLVAGYRKLARSGMRPLAGCEILITRGATLP
jgi:hypothetical protein